MDTTGSGKAPGFELVITVVLFLCVCVDNQVRTQLKFLLFVSLIAFERKTDLLYLQRKCVYCLGRAVWSLAFERSVNLSPLKPNQRD